MKGLVPTPAYPTLNSIDDVQKIKRSIDDLDDSDKQDVVNAFSKNTTLQDAIN